MTRNFGKTNSTSLLENISSRYGWANFASSICPPSLPLFPPSLPSSLRGLYGSYDSLIHWTIRTGRTTREYIRRSVRVVRLVSSWPDHSNLNSRIDYKGVTKSWRHQRIRMNSLLQLVESSAIEHVCPPWLFPSVLPSSPHFLSLLFPPPPPPPTHPPVSDWIEFSCGVSTIPQ